MYSHVASAHDLPEQYSPRERLAIEYAERFALDHGSLDDAFFARLREEFSDEEILDLAASTAMFLGFGRLTRVLRLDQGE